MSSTAPLNPEMAATNAVLFDYWFPADELQIPERVRPEVISKIGSLCKGIDDKPPAAFVMVLTWLTYPSAKILPFYADLEKSKSPAIQRFIRTPGGLARLNCAMITELFSIFFKGLPSSGLSKLPSSEMVAMLCREIYLATIWGLQLAVPLVGIQAPERFAPSAALYAKINRPTRPPNWLVYDPADASVVPVERGPCADRASSDAASARSFRQTIACSPPGAIAPPGRDWARDDRGADRRVASREAAVRPRDPWAASVAPVHRHLAMTRWEKGAT